MFGISRDALWAFGVHILTASGAFLAFLSLVAAAEGRFAAAFFWLGVALLVDGVDGPLARRLQVKFWWPHWSGDVLDHVIDYVTFVMIPAFLLYQGDVMGEYLSFVAAALIVVTSAIYYADTRMKTIDNGFMGFPVCWNMVAFVIFILSPPQWLAFMVVLIVAILTFMPIIFVHPMRVKVWRIPTLAVFALWSTAGLAALYHDFDAPLWIDVVVIASSTYLFCIGAVLQFFGKLH